MDVIINNWLLREMDLRGSQLTETIWFNKLGAKQGFFVQ